MSHYRQNSVSKLSEIWQKQEPTSGLSSPRSIIVSNGTVPSDLHKSPTALTVSPSGERSICSLENFNNSIPFKDTNPFFSIQNDQVEHESEPDDKSVIKHSQKKQKCRQLNRRKHQGKERQKPERFILTQRLSTRPKQPKCVSVQTDASMGSLEFIPECIGDGGRLRQCHSQLITKLEKRAEKKMSSVDRFFGHYFSESLKLFTSYLLMIFLIFTITSLVLDVEIVSELYRIASYYVKSFLWDSYQEEPESFIEKCWRYLIDKFQ